MASNLNWSMKKIKSNLDGIRPKSETFRFNVKGTGFGRFHHAESIGGVGFLIFTTDRRRSNDNRSVQKTLTTDLRIFRYSIDDDQEDNLEDCLFSLLLVVVVSFNSPAVTGRQWLLRRRVSCTTAAPNSWNLVLHNPQLWILYTLSLENYALILVVRE
jgi:hypothetical protein